MRADVWALLGAVIYELVDESKADDLIFCRRSGEYWIYVLFDLRNRWQIGFSTPLSLQSDLEGTHQPEDQIAIETSAYLKQYGF